MRLLRTILVALMLAVTTVAMGFEPSSEIVVVNGKRYYVHTIEQGHTLYSLARAYGVSEQQIIDCNENLVPESLSLGEKIYIPVVEPSKRDAKRSRKTQTAEVIDKDFRIHIVEKGQTLYSIAKSYKISPAIIEADNEGVDAENLSIGEQLRIRRSEMGFTSARQIERERAARDGERSDSVGVGQHLVQPGETIYSLSRRYSISEGELLMWNDLKDASELRAGMLIRISADSAEINSDDNINISTLPHIIDSLMRRDEVYAYLYGDGGIADSLATEPVDVEFVRLGANNTLKAVVMLPFHMRQKVNPNYVDFYRGVLLAMEDLKAEGYSVDLTVFDTENSAARIKDIVAYEEAMLDAQLIIGPVYEEELRHVLGHAEDNNIPVVSPLADIESLSSPVLFQMQSENDFEFTKFEPFLDSSREIITIYAATNDMAYVEEIKALLGERGSRDLIFAFNREPYFYQRGANGERGALVDIKALLRSSTPKTFFVVADKDTDIDRILTTLASTKSSIVDRGAIIGDYMVIGNRKWARLDNIERQSFFRNNTAFLVPYHAKRSESIIRSFDARYIKAFRTLPTMFSYRGYDAAIIFCRRMFTGLDDITTQLIKPLATTYRFEFRDGMYVNTEWSLEMYRPSFIIDVN